MAQNDVEYLAKALGATVEVARAFPTDKYDFWPTPQSMTVGEQIGHLAMCLDYFIAPVGEMLQARPPADDSTIDPLQRLEQAALRMTETLGRVPAEDWDRVLSYPDGYEMSPARAVLVALEHDAHHRGQLIVALRLLDIEPPKRWKDS